MSEDSKNGRVINVWGKDRIPPWFEPNAITEFPSTEKLTKTAQVEDAGKNLFWPWLRISAMTPTLRARLIAGGFTESEVDRGCFMMNDKGELVGALLNPQKAINPPRDNIAPTDVSKLPQDTIVIKRHEIQWSDDSLVDVARKRGLDDLEIDRLMKASFTNIFRFWVSSRGENWELIEARSPEEAACTLARRWYDFGHKGPFPMFVSLSNVPQPPSQGSRVYRIEVELQVAFSAKRLEYGRF